MIQRWWKGRLSRAVLAAGAILTATALLAGQQRPAPLAQPGLTPELGLVPSDAICFVQIRLGEVWNSELGKKVRAQLGENIAALQKQVEKNLGLGLGDIDKVTFVMLSTKDPEPVLIVSTAKPLDRSKVLTGLGENPEENKHEGKSYYVAKEGRKSMYFAGDRVFVVGEVEAIVQLLMPSKKGRLAGALAEAAKGHTVTAGFQLPAEQAAQMKNQPPPPLVWMTPLFDMEYGVVTFDLGDSFTLRGTIAFGDAAKARRGLESVQAGHAVLKPMLGAVIEQAGRDKKMAELLPALKLGESALAQAQVLQQGNAVQVQVSIKKDAAADAALVKSLVQAIVMPMEAAKRMTSANNLKQIAIALHNYEASHGQLPAHAIYSADGKPLLSWRVAILPYIEQDNLYKQFKLDEPWDSEHNKKLLKQMPAIYGQNEVKTKEPWLTFYQGFVGPGAFFEGDKGLSFAQIPDGTSNTLMIAEAGEAVPWTKPDDLKYDATQAPPKLGGLFGGDFNTAFCDGSVRHIKKTIDPQVLHRLIQRNDGQVIDSEKIP